MIIDFHAHCFPDKIAAAALDKLSRMSKSAPFTDGTLAGLTASMEKYGINRSVLLPVATHAGQTEHINDFAMQLNENHAAEGILSLGGIHPEYDGYKQELSRIAAGGLKGIKIHPVYQDTDINDVKFLRILDRAAELNLIVVTHAGKDIGFPGVERCSPSMIYDAVQKIGSFKFVLAHMGGWREWDEAISLLADTTVFVDTAFSFGRIKPAHDDNPDPAKLQMLDGADFERFLATFGAERILFGTDSPWSSQGETADFVKNLPISPEDKAKILGGNAEKLLE